MFIACNLVLTFDVCAQEMSNLQVGASRVNITPPSDAEFQMSGYGGRTDGFTGILDSLYYRTIVIDDGQNQGAIVVGDLLFTTNRMWDRISEKIENETNIPSENLLLAATHTHAAPTFMRDEQEIDGKLKDYIDDVIEEITQSVKSAQESRVPARMGIGEGYANININRIARTASGGYFLGQNPEGPSDKTVHVVRFEDLNGSPIAIFVNYAVHGVVGGPGNLLLSGDLPGATSRVVENYYGSEVVVPWTSGAAGDQNPIYAVLDNPNGGGIDPLNSMGQILGEEVIRVSENIKRKTTGATIRGAQKVVNVPGKERNEFDYSSNYKFKDADPLDIRLSTLEVGHIVFGCVSGEVLTQIGKRFKSESPFSNSIMVTHCNGSSGYLPDDEAYERPGYEIAVSRAKEGAETAIIDGLIDLLLSANN